MIASRSLRAVLSLLAATPLATFTGSAVAATQNSATPHHHHKKAATTEGKTVTHSSGHTEEKAAHHKHATHKATENSEHHTHATRHASEEKTTHHSKATHSGANHHHAAHLATGAAVGAAAGAAAAHSDTDDAAPAADSSATPAPTGPDLTKGTNTGLPLPRFAALRADDVNMRAGPGQRYPIQFIYHRRGLPVKIEREFDIWRLVEDPDGVKGWVHQATLVGSHDFVIPYPPGKAPSPDAAPQQKAASSDKPEEKSGNRHTESQVIGHVATAAEAEKIPNAVILRSSGDDSAAPVAVLMPGSVGTLRSCAAGSVWCQVTIQRRDGWLHRNQIWGLLPDEAYPPS
ncbi:hypothetical protein AA0472_1420 [Acetobacter estunensis NRIC 0472]|nr:SH3 domain-containing protein [Acetobacter estunensis]GBQ24427.1 hypothetical protein AA0472_1420 [Acetobacter estunensis NRIC 0472]